MTSQYGENTLTLVGKGIIFPQPKWYLRIIKSTAMPSIPLAEKVAITNKTIADFFAGIGLVSMGFKRANWETVYALDYDNDKAHAYKNHFQENHYQVKDIANAKGIDVPDVMLAHASFPCTDLSVAGERKGINQGESSSFWHFVRILSEMDNKKPPFVLLENVEGLLTSNDGKDLKSVLAALNNLNYHVDLLRINAANFVPQSRVRIFIVGISDEIVKKLDTDVATQISNLWSSDARSKKIVEYILKNNDVRWYFHALPSLPECQISLEDIIDASDEWWTEERTQYLYNQLHDRHKDLVNSLINSDKYSFFPAFRRMRIRNGKKQPTVELRTDGIAGCLRTPKGGSARQILVRVGKGKLDARLVNGKEVAHLMGASDFRIDKSLSLNQVLFGFGDAVCVPAIEWLARNYFDKLIV